tara:strand:- start:1751 stop:2296 length:546 start_codon:yes stop_codon:yes gene_type:complete
MSRIGKVPVTIPDGVQLKVDGSTVSVKGPKGALSFSIPSQVAVKIEDGRAVVYPVSGGREANALHGTIRVQVNNMVVGVTQGYEKALEIHGVGFRVQQQGNTLSFSLGYSHQVVFNVPKGIEAIVEKPTAVTLRGVSKYLVGQTAANIRALRPPDPYKAKGIRYAGEVIKMKAGKAGKAAK